MNDLLPSTERLHIPGADVVYYRRFLSDGDAVATLHRLLNTIEWRNAHSSRIPQPRLIAWYGDPGRSYSYSEHTLEPLPWTDDLETLRTSAARVADATFNCVLLNYYRDHNDSVGYHADNEPELGETPTIGSISLGETRTLTFKPRMGDEGETVPIELESGSLLVMKGDTQRNWLHAVAKESRPCGPRVNLTFRRILD